MQKKAFGQQKIIVRGRYRQQCAEDQYKQGGISFVHWFIIVASYQFV
jgi:hypothetical protein